MTSAYGALQGQESTHDGSDHAGVGIHPDLPEHDYHAHPAVSRSDIETIRRYTPAHFKASKDGEVEDKKTPALIEGDAIHALVLEPERFERQYCEGRPEYRKKADQEWRAEMREHGIEPLNPEVYERAHRIRDAVFQHPAARLIFDRGRAEESFIGRDPRTGELCKARPDWRMEAGTPVDFKTADDASPEAFGKSAYNYGYYIQAPYYTDVMRWAGGPDLSGSDFLFVVVEKSEPFAVAVYYADEAMVTKGRADYEQGLDRIAECRAAGEWPGYSDRVEPLSLPGWATKSYR